jgi:hypothetical protein
MRGGVRALKREGFRSVIIRCVSNHPTRQGCCYHQKRFALSDLPDASWDQLGPWFRCTICGSVGFVDMALDWTEKIDFSKRSGWQ